MSGGQTFASVWDVLADTPEQAANMRARAELMDGLRALVRDSGWTQSEAARRCGVTQPRMNDLLRGRISPFSLDALVNMATAAGQQARVRLEAAKADAPAVSAASSATSTRRMIESARG